MLALSLSTSCGGAKDPCSAPSSGAIGTPVVLSNKLARAMGSTVVALSCDTQRQQQARSDALTAQDSDASALVDGKAVRGLVQEMIVPVLPQFNGSNQFVETPRLLRVDKEGQVSELYRLPDPPASFETGFYSGTTINGTQVQIPRGLLMAVARASTGEVYVSNNVTGEIFKLSNGQRSSFARIEGVSSLTIDTQDNVYAVTAPVFGYSNNLLAAPRIVKLSPAGQASDFYVYPSDASRYSGAGFLNCKDARCVAMGFAMDLALDPSGTLYVASPFDAGILKIDAQGSAATLGGEMRGIAGLAVGPDKNVYFALSPTFDNNLAARQGLRVGMLDAQAKATTLFESAASEAHKTGFYIGMGSDTQLPLDVVLNLNLDNQGNLYLEDNNTHTLTLLPRR